MASIPLISRVSSLVQARGGRLLSRVERQTGVTTVGNIYITTDPARKYAHVYRDPDDIFAEPDSGYKSLPPEYEVWIGNTLLESIRVLKALPFIMLHEAMHVVAAKNENFFLKPIEEIEIDRMAVQGFYEPATVESMLSFSRLILSDNEQGGLGAQSVAREMAKLKWVTQEPDSPPELKRAAANLYSRYPELLKPETPRSDLYPLIVEYSGLFTRPIEISGISAR